jgi:hypothetical protein
MLEMLLGFWHPDCTPALERLDVINDVGVLSKIGPCQGYQPD